MSKYSTCSDVNQHVKKVSPSCCFAPSDLDEDDDDDEDEDFEDDDEWED